MKYNIAIVEDDKLILELVANLFKSSQKFEHIEMYDNGLTFLNALENSQHKLDVILLDFRLGETDAEKILEELHNKSVTVPVIILTSNYNQYLIGYMVRAGASAYLPKNIKTEELIAIVEEVIQKGHYISSEQFPHLKNAFSEDTSNLSKQVLGINGREIELIYLLANQLSAKEIANKLYVSYKTIDGHKNALFVKTKTKTVVGLVLFAIKNGLIRIENIDFGQ